MNGPGRVLVVGATGVLGAPATRALAATGRTVFGTSRRADRLAAVERAGGRGLVLDVFDPVSVDAALEASRPDAIVFLATDLAGLDFGANARLRLEGAPALVAAARAAGVPRFVAESVAWAADDDAPVAALERAVLAHPGGVVLRFGLLYGPGTWYAADGSSTRAAGDGEVVATTDATSWVHVDDAVSATVAALDWPPGVVPVVDDDPTRLAEWGPVLVRRAGFAGEPRLTARAPGRAVDGARARALGWAPAHPSWRDGLGLD
ncbi:NAD-dependent epimerase/dehydratase family protein [Agromyces sp. MMS24-K17]|uniref:NAD-dependent epimerase/dehydratase family protein n=1 Tax=Agromyces sp. MMS24-K17 TaxID=3372850 RepID=UPI003755280A